MDRVVRPSGLTALGVINLVFGGFQTLLVLFSLFALGCSMTPAMSVGDVADGPARIVAILLSAGIGGTLIASGIGFLRMNRMGGQILANAYVILVVFRMILERGDATLITIAGLVYPVIVVVFVNVVFRDIWRSRHPRYAEGGDRDGGSVVPRVVLIAVHSARQILRSAGGVLLCISALVICLFVAGVVMMPLELFGGLEPAVEWGPAADVGVGELELLAMPLMERLLDGAPGATESGAWARFLLQQRPGLLSILFVVFIYIVPVIMIFVSFHQISSDSRHHGLRYLLLRASRTEIYLGKFLAGMAVGLLLLLVLTLTIVLYVNLSVGWYAARAVAGWGMRGGAMLMVLSVPFVAMGIGFSGLSDSGIGNLGAGLGLTVVFPLLVRSLERWVWEPLGVLAYLVPLKSALLLLHPSWWVVALGVVVSCAYAAVYLLLGLLAFRKRSL